MSHRFVLMDCVRPQPQYRRRIFGRLLEFTSKFVCLLVLWWWVLPAGPVLGSPTLSEPLWKQITTRLEASEHYRAGMIRNRLTVYNGSGKLLGVIESVSQLAMESGAPVWRKVEETRHGDPGMVITMDVGIQKDPRSVLAEYDTWRFLRDDVVNGHPVKVWQGTESTDARNLATAFLDEARVRPDRIEFTMPYRSILGTIPVVLRLEYGEAASGVWLPHRLITEQTSKLLFRERRIVMETEYENWQPARKRGD